MSNPNRRAGRLFFTVNGVRHDAKGNFTYHLGSPKREAITGTDTVHGYRETVSVPFIEGAITDRKGLNLKQLFALDGITITLELANGKTIILREAWFAGDGTASTEEAEVPIRFEGIDAEEMQ